MRLPCRERPPTLPSAVPLFPSEQPSGAVGKEAQYRAPTGRGSESGEQGPHASVRRGGSPVQGAEWEARARGQDDLALALLLTSISCVTFRPAGDHMRPWLSRLNEEISDLMSYCRTVLILLIRN